MHEKNGENGQTKKAFWVAGCAMVTVYRGYICQLIPYYMAYYDTTLLINIQ